MGSCRSFEDSQNAVNRLKRIEGQVRALQKMVEGERECVEILNQISSSISALKGVWLEIVRGHLRNCLRKSVDSGKKYDDVIDDVVAQIRKIR